MVVDESLSGKIPRVSPPLFMDNNWVIYYILKDDETQYRCLSRPETLSNDQEFHSSNYPENYNREFCQHWFIDGRTQDKVLIL